MIFSPAVIELNTLRFRGLHGMTTEEQLVGCEFVVNIKLTISSNEQSFLKDNLKNTVNYADVYLCIRQAFLITSHTIENIATRILDSILKQFPLVIEAEIKLEKLNPPISADCHSAAIILKAKR